jgi:hypothetical protein
MLLLLFRLLFSSLPDSPDHFHSGFEDTPAACFLYALADKKNGQFHYKTARSDS